MMTESLITTHTHTPVLLAEVLEGLNIQPSGIYVDATFGRGGHSEAILKRLGPKGTLWVMDRDPEAIVMAKALAEKDKRVQVKKAAFSGLMKFCQENALQGKVNGILLDLGVSSPQLDSPHRGFSFRLDGPLDMRMDPTTGMSAADWINQAEESEIDGVLKEYGEERFHRRIARAIIGARNSGLITTTKQLADIVTKANPAWEKHKHPATRSFQAIRLFINNELGELIECLDQALEVLAPKGRLAVISFHSLEDRIVKRFIQKHERGDEHPIRLPIRDAELNRRCRRVGRFVKPTDEETHQNPRARSARLRIAEKLGEVL